MQWPLLMLKQLIQIKEVANQIQKINVVWKELKPWLKFNDAIDLKNFDYNTTCERQEGWKRDFGCQRH